jgi:hypothetical protein
VIHAILLQQPIPKPLPVEEMQRRLQSALKQRVDAAGDGVSVYQEVLRPLQAEVTKRQKFWTIRRYSVDALRDASLRKHIQSLFRHQPDKTLDSLFKWCSRKPRALEVSNPTCALGLDPVFAIGAGSFCLLVSVLFFAYDTQPLPIFLACVAITSAVVVSMVVSSLMGFKVNPDLSDENGLIFEKIDGVIGFVSGPGTASEHCYHAALSALSSEKAA